MGSKVPKVIGSVPGPQNAADPEGVEEALTLSSSPNTIVAIVSTTLELTTTIDAYKGTTLPRRPQILAVLHTPAMHLRRPRATSLL